MHPLGHEVHPQPKQEQILGQFMLGGLDWRYLYDAILRATTKKKVVNVFGKKVHPPRQNPGYAYATPQKYTEW